MNILRIALAAAFLALPAQADSPQWSIDAATGVAHHKASGGFCPARLGGLPRTSQSDIDRRGDAAICAYGRPRQPDAQRISIQEMPDVPRAELDATFRKSLQKRFPGSIFVPEVAAMCQEALVAEMGGSGARCMVIRRDGFTAFFGFHIMDNWSFQPMIVTGGEKGLADENVRAIGKTFGELYKVEMQFMMLR